MFVWHFVGFFLSMIIIEIGLLIYIKKCRNKKKSLLNKNSIGFNSLDTNSSEVYFNKNLLQLTDYSLKENSSQNINDADLEILPDFYGKTDKTSENLDPIDIVISSDLLKLQIIIHSGNEKESFYISDYTSAIGWISSASTPLSVELIKLKDRKMESALPNYCFLTPYVVINQYDVTINIDLEFRNIETSSDNPNNVHIIFDRNINDIFQNGRQYNRFKIQKGKSVCLCSSFYIESNHIGYYSNSSEISLRKKIELFIDLLENGLKVMIGDDVFIFDSYRKKALIIFLRIIIEYLKIVEKRYLSTKNNWFKIKNYQDEEFTSRIKRSKQISFIKSNIFSKEGKCRSSDGKYVYNVSLKSCSCQDFHKREIDKIVFIPCKHMFALANKFGYGIKPVRKLPKIEVNSIYDEIFNKKSFKKSEHSDYKEEHIAGWKNPLVVLDTHIIPRNIVFIMNRFQIMVDKDSCITFQEYSYSVAINGKMIEYGECFEDVVTGNRKFNNAVTCEIYKLLLKDESVLIELFFNSVKQIEFKISETQGFGDTFYHCYNDFFFNPNYS